MYILQSHPRACPRFSRETSCGSRLFIVPQIAEALGRMILEVQGSRSAMTVWKAVRV